MSSVCPSVTLVDHDHIGWKSWKLIAWTISPTPSLFVAQRSSTYSQNMEKFWGENVRSTPMSISSGWIESTESHVILGGDVAVCLLLSAHRAVIFAIAQLSCLSCCACILEHWRNPPYPVWTDLSACVRLSASMQCVSYWTCRSAWCKPRLSDSDVRCAVSTRTVSRSQRRRMWNVRLLRSMRGIVTCPFYVRTVELHVMFCRDF